MAVFRWTDFEGALQPGWTAPRGPLRIAQVEHGYVLLNGTLEADDSVPGGTAHALTLPAGLRPTIRQVFNAQFPENQGAAVVVEPDGKVYVGALIVPPDALDDAIQSGLAFLGTLSYPVD